MISITDAILAAIYIITAMGTTWFTGAVASALLETNPRTRNYKLGWLGWPIGILLGLAWPITIPCMIIAAGVTK